MSKRIKRGRVRRFSYITGPRRRIAHMANRARVGTRTYCGVMIGADWSIAKTDWARRTARSHRCTKCQQTGGNLHG